jgi:hypothetical protein
MERLVFLKNVIRIHLRLHQKIQHINILIPPSNDKGKSNKKRFALR